MIDICRAQAVDLASVQDCARLAYARYLNRMTQEPAPMHADFAGQIHADQLYVARIDGHFAGYVVAIEQEDHIMLENVAVLPSLSGQGVGLRLIAHVEQLARDLGKPVVQLYTNEAMTENLLLYSWLGYSKTGKRCENGFHRVYFRKNVSVHIRTATEADAAILHAWDEKPHIRKAVSLSGEYAFEADWSAEIATMDDTSEFLVAEVDGRPIGAMQIIDPAREPTHYWGDVADDLRAIDIWIGEVDYLGKGYGTVMMRFAINRCFSSADVNAILIDPLVNNTDAHRFYKRLGFEFLERRWFDDESDCLVFRLERSRVESLEDS